MSIAEHPELLQFLEELDSEAPGDTTVLFRCDSGYHGKIVDGRWFVDPCRGKRCRVRGAHTHHVWDIQTGEMNPLSDEPGSAHQKG